MEETPSTAYSRSVYAPCTRRVLSQQEAFRPALDELSDLRAPQRMIDEVARQLAALVEREDPLGAADAIVRDSRIPLAAIDTTLYHLGRLHPQQALEWHSGHTADGSLDPIGGRDANRIQSSFASLVAGIAESDVPLAAEKLQSMPDKTARLALERIASRTAMEEFDSTFDQLVANDESRTITQVATETFAGSMVSRGEFDAAWVFVAGPRQNQDGYEPQSLMAKLLRSEANNDVRRTPEIADWIALNRDKLPPGSGSLRHVLGRVLVLWEHAWTLNLPPHGEPGTKPSSRRQASKTNLIPNDENRLLVVDRHPRDSVGGIEPSQRPSAIRT